MWEPVGPLPAAVYWRRRLVAVASTTLVIILMGWGFAGITRPLRTDDTDHAALTAPAVVSSDPVVAPDGGVTDPGFVPPVAGEPLPVDPPTGGPATGDPAGGARPPGPVVPDGLTASGSTASDPTSTAPANVTTTDAVPPSSTSEQVFPDETPRSTIPVPPPEPVPAGGPVPCTNDMLRVTAEVDPFEHRVGQRPTFRLVVVNVSAQPCVRDLDAVRQEIVVWSADLALRLWSSNDCVNPTTDDLRTLVPGQPVAFAVRWAGRTTTPGCAEPRTGVPPGDYQLRTRVDDVVSDAVPFRRLP